MKSVAVFLENKHKICYGINYRVAMAFVDCFRYLGFRTQLVRSVEDLGSGEFDIVFSVAASHESPFSPKRGTTYIMYQNEQLPQRDITTHRANLCMERFGSYAKRYDIIFDFSAAHIEYLRDRGYNVHHIQIGYHKLFDYTEQFEGEEEPYDISFVGNLVSENGRRKYILANLHEFCQKKGYTTYFSPVVLDMDYYRLHHRSKVCLNIHHTYIRCCEGQKIVDLLSNRRFVLTEPFGTPEPYRDGMHLSVRDITDFEQAIEYYVEHPDARAKVAAQGYQFVSQHLKLVHGLHDALKRVGLA